MGIFKKVVCMGLCAAMVIPFAACEGGSKKPTKEEKAASQAAAYVDGALTTIENARSFKLKLVSKEASKSEYSKYPEQSYSASETMTCEMTVSIADNDVAVYCVSTTESVYDEETYVWKDESIYKEGILYIRSYEVEDGEEAPQWEKLDEENGLSLDAIPMDMISKLLETKEVDDVVKASLEEYKALIAQEILEDKVVDGKVSIDYDYASYLNGWIEYLAGLDEQKATLGSVVNKVLAEISPSLTAEGILGQLSAYSKMTVSEALTSIDAFLTLQHKTTLQGIKDAIVNSELMSVVFKEILQADADTIAAIKNWKFDSLKTGEVGSLVLGDLINGYLMESGYVPTPEEGETPVDYVKEFLDTAKDMLGKTLAELDLSFDLLKSYKFNQLNVSNAMTFDDNNSLKDWSLSAAFAMQRNEYEEEKQIGCLTASLEVVLTISEISSSAAVIVAPSIS